MLAYSVSPTRGSDASLYKIHILFNSHDSEDLKLDVTTLTLVPVLTQSIFVYQKVVQPVSIIYLLKIQVVKVMYVYEIGSKYEGQVVKSKHDSLSGPKMNDCRIIQWSKKET